MSNDIVHDGLGMRFDEGGRRLDWLMLHVAKLWLMCG